MSVIQSVIFNRPVSLDEAKIFLKTHKFKYGKVDVTPHTIRFRQRDPKPLEAAGYYFRTVPFKYGHFVIAYPPKR